MGDRVLQRNRHLTVSQAMKILFLDIDGVLNSAAFFGGRKWSDQIDKFQMADVKDISTWEGMLDPKALELLDDFLMGAGETFIVVSSSWREVHPVARLKQIFLGAGALPGTSKIAERIIDRTDVGRTRPAVIREWINRFAHEIDTWAALDDMPLEGLTKNHVKTTWADGLQSHHIAQLREILGGR